MPSDYPVQFTVDYPDRQLARLSSAFRIFTVIPIAVVLCAFGGSGSSLLSVPPLLMILYRQKYPRWWYDWNFNVMSFTNRVTVYGLLLTDVYPATDEEQSSHLALPYPDVQSDLNRWLPLVKWLLAIPHYIVLAFLLIGVVVSAVIAWFAILFTGRFPRGLFDYIVGVLRWGNRVVAYAFVLTTDAYPPFSLSA